MKRIVITQLAVLSLFFVMTLANEFFDFPHFVLGEAPTTPGQRYGEVILECLIFGSIVGIEYFTIIYLLKRVKILEGLLPICANCHKIRNQDKWDRIEAYFKQYSLIEFTHSICPECKKKLYPELPNVWAHNKKTTAV